MFRLSKTNSSVGNIFSGLRFHSTNLPKATEIKSKHLPRLPPAEPLNQTKYLSHTFPSLDSVQPESVAFQADGKALDKKPKSWYFISRSRSNNLPVYLDYKVSGKITTIIRKIEGNVSQLRNDLLIELAAPRKDVVIKDASKQIVIRGDYAQQVKEILGKYF